MGAPPPATHETPTSKAPRHSEGFRGSWAVRYSLPQTASVSASVCFTVAVTFATAWRERLTHLFSVARQRHRKSCGLSNFVRNGCRLWQLLLLALLRTHGAQRKCVARFRESQPQHQPSCNLGIWRVSARVSAGAFRARRETTVSMWGKIAGTFGQHSGHTHDWHIWRNLAGTSGPTWRAYLYERSVSFRELGKYCGVYSECCESTFCQMTAEGFRVG